MLTLGNNENYASVRFQLPENTAVEPKSVYREILDNNAERMDSAALLFLGDEVTYRQLFDQVDRIADILTSFGIKKGDIIPCCINGTPQTVSLLLACSKMGVCAMMLTPKTTPEMLKYAVESTHAPLMFCMTQFYPIFASMEAVDELHNLIVMPCDSSINTDDKQQNKMSGVSNVIYWSEFLNWKVTEKCEEIRNEDLPLAICSTTGSTGIPKGIVHLNSGYLAVKHSYENDWISPSSISFETRFRLVRPAK